MAISRFTEDCDVYIYRTIEGLAIQVKGGDSYSADDEQDAVRQLEALKATQPELKIPDWVIKTLKLQMG